MKMVVANVTPADIRNADKSVSVELYMTIEMVESEGGMVPHIPKGTRPYTERVLRRDKDNLRTALITYQNGGSLDEIAERHVLRLLRTIEVTDFYVVLSILDISFGFPEDSDKS